MSSEAEAIDVIDETCCASCGIAANDDVKLKKCTSCHLVKYCGVKCQREHRSKHKRECKKRAAEIRDEILFKQPESSHFGECPICCLPLPLDEGKSIMMACCSQQICKGCSYTNAIREINDSIQQRCPFCRRPLPKTDAEVDRMVKRRVEVNDPVALREFGTRCHFEGDYGSAIEYWTRAARLGEAGAHYQLSFAYNLGDDVEKDMKKAIYHAEQAAIGGHYIARHNLGYEEYDDGKVERAAKHWIIAASLGFDDSLESLKDCYKEGCIQKEDFAAALRAHKAAVDATKSPQREVRTSRNVLIELHPSIRIPRTYKRFAGLMVQLLHKMKIKASDNGTTLMKVIKNPFSQHLPVGTRVYGMSCKGLLYSPHNLAKQLVPLDPNSSDEGQSQVCFIIGAMAAGHVTTEDHPYIEKMFSISEYPLSGASAINRILGSIEHQWAIV